MINGQGWQYVLEEDQPEEQEPFGILGSFIICEISNVKNGNELDRYSFTNSFIYSPSCGISSLSAAPATSLHHQPTAPTVPGMATNVFGSICMSASYVLPITRMNFVRLFNILAGAVFAAGCSLDGTV